ncbi:MAG: hypothetical protein WAN50_01165 [Minisyncoccia bacterium]
MLFYYSKPQQRSEDGKWRAAAEIVDSSVGSGYATEYILDEIYETPVDAEAALAKVLLPKGYVEIYSPKKVGQVVADFLRKNGFKLAEQSPVVDRELVVFSGTQETALDFGTLPKVPGWMSPVVNCHEAFGIVGCKIEYAKIKQPI